MASEVLAVLAVIVVALEDLVVVSVDLAEALVDLMAVSKLQYNYY